MPLVVEEDHVAQRHAAVAREVAQAAARALNFGGREQQPWIPYAWGTTLFAFVAVRVPVMMKHWKTIYKQALKDQGYHAAVERLGGEVPRGRAPGYRCAHRISESGVLEVDE